MCQVATLRGRLVRLHGDGNRPDAAEAADQQNQNNQKIHIAQHPPQHWQAGRHCRSPAVLWGLAAKGLGGEETAFMRGTTRDWAQGPKSGREAFGIAVGSQESWRLNQDPQKGLWPMTSTKRT